MTKENRKNIIKTTISVITAVILSLSFIFIVNAEIDIKPDADTSYDVTYGDSLTISAATIQSWFDLTVNNGSDYVTDDSLDFSAMTIQVLSGSPSANFEKVNDGVTFTPTAADIGKTFVFTFNVRGSASGAASDGVSGSNASINVTVNVTAPANATPSIQIDYTNETLTGFDSSATYTINGTTHQNISAPIAIETDWLGTSLLIIQKGDSTHRDSIAQELPIPLRPAAPTDLGSTPETSFKANDGTITGFTAGVAYQYSADGVLWGLPDINISAIPNLAPGNHYVRFAATNTAFASASATVTVDAAGFTYPLVFTGGQLKYNGNEAIAYGVLPAGSYTVSGNTLTLNGVNFTTAAEIALDLSGVPGAKLNLSSTNAVTSTYSGANASYGIKAAGSLFINGTGSLTATAGNATSTTSAGIYNAGSLFIQSGTVTAIGGNGSGSASYGISATADVSITGGSVTATGEALQGYGINSGGMINIQNGAVTAEGKTGAFNKSPADYPVSYNWSASSGGSGNKSNYTYSPSYKTLNITTTTGVDTPTVTYNKYDDFDSLNIRYSLASGTTITSISCGETTLVENTDYFNSSNVLIEISYNFVNSLPNTGATLTINTSDDVNPTVVITFNNVPATNTNGLVLTTGGKLQINGTNATQEQLGGGTYTWNGTTKTLTLNNVNFQTSAEIALDLTAVLNVKFNLIGTNTFTSIYSGTSSTYGITTTGTITIEGTGSLSVTGGTSTSGNSNGVTGNVTVNGGEFNATGGTATGNSNGVTGNVTVNGGNLTVQGDNKASSSTPTVNVAKYNWTVSIPLKTESSGYPYATPNFTDAYYIQILTQTGVNPETPTFNKYTDFDGLEIRYSLANGDTLTNISNGDTTLTENTHYTTDGYTVTFLYDYLKTLPGTTATLTFNTSGTVDPTVRITLDNTLPTNEYGLVLTAGGQLQINNVSATREQLGGGSYSWDNSTKTLTLTDVNFKSSAAFVLDLRAISGINLVINGSNSFTSAHNGGFSTYAITTNGTLTISGTGSLSAIGSNENNVNNSSGIDANEVIINGGNITVSGKSNAIRVTEGLTTTINIPSYGWSADLSNDFYPSNALTVGSQKTITITSRTAVSPTTADVNIFSTPADISIIYSLESGTTFESITNGENTLTKNTHYTVAGNTVTIKSSYLRTLSPGTATLTFNTSGATDPIVTLIVVNRNPAYTYYDLSEFTEDPDITVTNGQTVVITGTKGSSGSPANFGLTFNVEAGGNVIWDYATFTTSAEYAVTVNGHSGTKGTFEMTDGAINAIRTNSVYALSNYVNLTIKDGTVSGASSSNLAFAISNNPGANLTINDGIISANSSIWSYGIWNNGTVLINGGIIAATGNGNGSDALINDGTMTVKGDATVIGITNIYAGTNRVTFSENAVSILYDKTMTNPVLYSTNGLTPDGGTAVWNTVGGKHGISWRNGTNSGFFEISGVTTTGNVSSDATIDISFIQSQPTFTVTDTRTLTVTGENTSADFYLYFALQGASEVIWDDAKFCTTYSQAVSAIADSINGKFTMDSGVIASSDGTGLFTNVSNIKISGTLIAEQPIVGDIHNSPDLVGDYVLITLPDPLGTYIKGTSIGLTVEPAEATAVWDIQSGEQGISWANGTNTGFIVISGASVSNPTPTYAVTVTNGTADKTIYEANETVTITPTAPQEGYRIASVTTTPSTAVTAQSNGTYTFTMPSAPVSVTVAYEAIPEVPGDNGNNDNSGDNGNNNNTGESDSPKNVINLGGSDAAPPPKKDYTVPAKPDEDKDPDDNTNQESAAKLTVNGETADVSVAMPVEPGDKTADVKIDGKTVETYSLTAAEAIADGEITKAFVSVSGAIAGVTTGGNVIAGGNESESLNSFTTILALEEAAIAALEEVSETTNFSEGEEPEIPLITITAGQEVTAVSDDTMEKIIAVQNEYGINAQIQKNQYSEDENGQNDELIYRITLPVTEENVRDILLGADFDTALVQASVEAFEKTFGNTDVAGFALKQKETFGVSATIQVKMSAIGFTAEAGDTVCVAIFDHKTGEFTQVDGTVGENGFITFNTDKSGIVVISATAFRE